MIALSGGLITMFSKKYPNLKSLYAFYGAYKYRIAAYILAILLGSGLTLALPYVSSNIILNLTAGNYNPLVVYCAVLLGLILACNGVEYITDWMYSKTGNFLFFEIRMHQAFVPLYEALVKRAHGVSV